MSLASCAQYKGTRPAHADGTKLDGTTDGEPTGGVWKTHVQKHARVCAPQALEYANVAQTRPNVPGGAPASMCTANTQRKQAKGKGHSQVQARCLGRG